jgi:hypothetical protein
MKYVKSHKKIRYNNPFWELIFFTTILLILTIENMSVIN